MNHLVYKPIFNDDVTLDVHAVLAHIEGIISEMGVVAPPFVDPTHVQEALMSMTREFPHTDGIYKASCFKKAANFLCCFIQAAPIKTRLPDSVGALSKYDVNVVVGLDICLNALHGAELACKDGKKSISNKLAISKHSYIDMLEMLEDATPKKHYKYVAVLLEQITYKTNPDCQYSELAYGG